MTDLSPAAQAVLDAFGNTGNGEYIEGVWIVNEQAMLATALRAVADQVVPEGFADAYDCCLEIVAEIRDDILAIAAELEGME